MNINERIHVIRTSLNLTMEKFGERLGVQKSAISKIEHGQCSVSEQITKSICREFGVDYTWLTTGFGDMLTNAPQGIIDELAMQYGLTDFDKTIIDMYISLPPRARNAIKEIILQKLDEKGWKKEEQISKYDSVPDTPEELEALYLNHLIKKNGTDGK